MEGHLSGGVVVVGEDAKQRFHDSRGYGIPKKGNEIELDPVEAAHLLLRGDLDNIDGMDFIQFVSAQKPDFSAQFSTYLDLRFRGFYLTPASTSNNLSSSNIDFTVYERGTKPPEGVVKYELRVIGERSTIPTDQLGEHALAIVDEEGELVTREVNARFINGNPSALEATYVWKTEIDFERFMRFAKRYAESHGMGYSQTAKN